MDYTKGEWKSYKTDNKPERWTICAGDTGEKGIAHTVLDDSITPAERQANAHLIAKSPRMYEVIKYLATNGWNAGVSEEAKAIFGELAEGGK